MRNNKYMSILRDKRIETNMTTYTLAKRLEIPHDLVNSLENLEDEIVHMDTLIWYAKKGLHLDITFDFIKK